MSSIFKYTAVFLVGLMSGGLLALSFSGVDKPESEGNVTLPVSDEVLTNLNAGAVLPSINSNFETNERASQPKLISKQVALQEVERYFIQRDMAGFSDEDFWWQHLYTAPTVDEKLNAIEELTNRGAIDKLASGLADESVTVKVATIEGLARVGSEDAIRTLASVLYSDKSPDMRVIVIKKLEDFLYDPQTEYFLQSAMQHDTSSKVRKAAAEALNEVYP